MSRKKNKIQFTGHIRSYILWPLRFSILVLAFNVMMYFVGVKPGLITTAFTAVYIIAALLLYLLNRSMVVNEFISFATQYGQVQKQLLRELETPYALLDENGKIIWTNESFEQVFHVKSDYRKNISSLLNEFHKGKLPNMEAESEMMVSYEEKDYRVCMKKVSVASMIGGSEAVDSIDYDSYLIAFFMFDETEIIRLQKENEEQKLAIGLIYLDNYEEALESVEEVRRSLLVALIDRKINKYASEYDGLVKKLEKDKYIIIIQKSNLVKMQENRFELLEDVKTVNIGNEMAVTLSIGFGIGEELYTSNYEYARNAIDLALGRGGDQAIVKTSENVVYYGGKSQMTEKNTRVKARVKAHALREIIETNDQIIVMGHKLIDVDAFGAAIGICRIAKNYGKKVHVVIDNVTNTIRPLMDNIRESGEYDSDICIDGDRALALADKNTALVVVDVNKPSYTECEELLEKVSTIVVIDHHRQGVEKIDNATLSYVEPYASSASEMVAEILQYISDDIKIKPVEADCLYSGILLDTNNFVMRTGVRTFEAAAFLRRNGADVVRVRKLFRDNMEDYKARTEALRGVELYSDKYAISLFDAPEDIDSPTVIAAQAANELLNIEGIKASFVLTDYREQIYISARSIDEVNVQVIMEKLGGGGHMTVAGAQLADCTLEEAKQQLIDTIEKMQKEGEL